MAELIVHNPPRAALKASGYIGSPEGDIELIGPSVATLEGGCSGTMVRTKAARGRGKLIIRSEGLKEQCVEFEIG